VGVHAGDAAGRKILSGGICFLEDAGCMAGAVEHCGDRVLWVDGARTGRVWPFVERCSGACRLYQPKHTAVPVEVKLDQPVRAFYVKVLVCAIPCPYAGPAAGDPAGIPAWGNLFVEHRVGHAGTVSGYGLLGG